MLGVSEVKPGVRRFSNTDNTLLSAVVDEIFAENPMADAFCLPQFDDGSVLLRVGAEAASALARVREAVMRGPRVDRHTERCAWATCASLRAANLWRRALMTRVMTVAAASCEMLENTSGVVPEVVAHRVGQLAVCGAATEGAEFEGRISVQGRDVLGRDLQLPAGLSVADKEVLVLPLSACQAFRCRVRLRASTTLDSGHSRHSAMAGVEYWPAYEARGSQEALAELAAALAKLGVAAESMPGALIVCGARREFMREFLEHVEPTGEVRLIWESRGQLSALTCLESARARLLRECEELAVHFG